MYLNKKLILVIVVFVITFLTSKVVGQEYLDTIRLQMPNKTTVEYLMNYGEKKYFEEKKKNKRGKERVRYVSKPQDLAKSVDLQKVLQDFLSRWNVLGITDLEEKEPLKIVDKDRRIVITERENPIVVYFPEGKRVALNVEGKHQLNLPQEDYVLNIYFDDVKQLEELLKLKFKDTFQNADEELQEASDKKERKFTPLSAWLSVDKREKVNIEDFSLKYLKLQDYVGLTIGSGIENVKGDWNGNLKLGMSLVLADDRRYKSRFDLSYEFMYNFSGERKAVNHWLDVGYCFNLNEGTKKVDWWGPSLGFLIKRKGDFFEKNTLRLGITKKIKSVTITPRIYFQDFFKDIYPGINISFHLL